MTTRNEFKMMLAVAIYAIMATAIVIVAINTTG